MKVFTVILASIIVFAIFFAGNSHGELSPVEYVKWVEEEGNGFLQIKNMDELEFRAQFKPHDYIIMKETGIDPAKQKEEFEKEKNELGAMQYFTFTLKTPEGTDPLKYKIQNEDEYFARVKYYSFDIQEDFVLVDGVDTMNCMLAHFERNFGVAPELTCLVGFPPSKNAGAEQNKSLIYYDRAFNTGRLIFGFSANDINALPKLKY